MRIEDWLDPRAWRRWYAEAPPPLPRVWPVAVPRPLREIAGSTRAFAREGLRAVGSEGGPDERYEWPLGGACTRIDIQFHWSFLPDLVTDGPLGVGRDEGHDKAAGLHRTACDAFTRGEWAAALAAAERAVQAVVPGHPEEWRFHVLVGVLRLGWPGCDAKLTDPEQAEMALRLAGRGARVAGPGPGAATLMLAGWSALAGGAPKRAIEHFADAAAIDTTGEAAWQGAWLHAVQGAHAPAFERLRAAMKLDVRYALKAAADEAMQRFGERLADFLAAQRSERIDAVTAVARPTLDEAAPWSAIAPEIGGHEAPPIWRAIGAGETSWGLLDLDRYARDRLSAHDEDVRRLVFELTRLQREVQAAREAFRDAEKRFPVLSAHPAIVRWGVLISSGGWQAAYAGRLPADRAAVGAAVDALVALDDARAALERRVPTHVEDAPGFAEWREDARGRLAESAGKLPPAFDPETVARAHAVARRVRRQLEEATEVLTRLAGARAKLRKLGGPELSEFPPFAEWREGAFARIDRASRAAFESDPDAVEAAGRTAGAIHAEHERWANTVQGAGWSDLMQQAARTAEVVSPSISIEMPGVIAETPAPVPSTPVMDASMPVSGPEMTPHERTPEAPVAVPLEAEAVPTVLEPTPPGGADVPVAEIRARQTERRADMPVTDVRAPVPERRPDMPVTDVRAPVPERRPDMPVTDVRAPLPDRRPELPVVEVRAPLPDRRPDLPVVEAGPRPSPAPRRARLWIAALVAGALVAGLVLGRTACAPEPPAQGRIRD